MVLMAVLIFAALLLLSSAQWARRLGLPEAVGFSTALCALALAGVLVPENWRAWLAGGGLGDRTLGFLREVGLTGLLFLAGAGFPGISASKLWRMSCASAGAGLFFGVVVMVLLATFGHQSSGPAIVAAAAIASSSLWLPSELTRHLIEKDEIVPASAKCVATVLTLVSLLAVHFFSVFQGLASRHPSKSVYTVVALYELVKWIVFFSFAYGAATRFLFRAQSRTSPFRLSVGYLLIAGLVFVLALSAIGQLGAFVWAFVAGALLSRSEGGKMLARSHRPVAIALLLSFALLSILLQTHGRSLAGTSTVWFLVAIAIVGKFLALWTGARLGGASGNQATLVAGAALASGETAILFLGFGVTKWLIEAPSYFGILVFAFLSTVLGSIVWHWARPKTGALKPSVNLSASKLERTGKRQNLKAQLLVVCLSAGLLAGELQAEPNRALPPTGTASWQVRPSGLPREVEAMLDGLGAKVKRQAELATRLIQAQSFYRQAEESYKKGDLANADADFVRARQILLSTEEELFYEPSLHTQFLEIERRIAALKGVVTPGLIAKGGRFSIQANEQIQAYLRYFQGKGQNVVRTALSRLPQYEPMMRKIFREESVPEELIYVGLVESAYNPYAHSQAGASGIWQFVPDTGKRYGLKRVGTFDERHDPEKSTRAAARYLRDLYAMFGDWPLALAAYNAGEYRVLRIVKKTESKDFWQMSSKGLLPEETANYVPAVLAAVLIGKQGVQQKLAMPGSEARALQVVTPVRVGNEN